MSRETNLAAALAGTLAPEIPTNPETASMSALQTNMSRVALPTTCT